MVVIKDFSGRGYTFDPRTGRKFSFDGKLITDAEADAKFDRSGNAGMEWLCIALVLILISISLVLMNK
jgi:hypothetical protein